MSLLDRPKVAIVGARKASGYAKQVTYQLASLLAKKGCAVVSGGAMGIDAMAHRGAGAENSIAVLANGLDIKYPAINKELLGLIEQNGLLLSRFEEGFRPTRWSFVLRNEIVVAMSEALVVSEAQKKSGSMRSVEFAIKHKKPIFVLPHRLGESEGTQELLEKGIAQAIYNLEHFTDRFGQKKSETNEIEQYLQNMPSYEEALKRYGQKIMEMEIEGLIEIKDMRIYYRGKS